VQPSIRENLVDGKEVGCGVCPDKLFMIDAVQEPYGFFNGNVKA